MKSIIQKAIVPICNLLCPFIILLQCSPIVLNKQLPQTSLSFQMELTDINQQIVADSLGAELARRLLLYSEEKKNFKLVKPNEISDYKFTVRIISFRLIPIDTLAVFIREKNAIENKCDRINDSIREKYKPLSPAALTTANIATNVAINAVLLPLGFVGVAVISNQEPKSISPSKSDINKLDSLSKEAYIGYSASITDNKGKIRWKKKGIEKYGLYYLTSEQEQLKVLARNVVLNFEGKIPFLKL